MSGGEAKRRVGVVAIGRNEGERLRRCLESLDGRAAAIVYVDSGSTDGSVALAQSMGAAVVELDRSTRFSAARARNEGFARLGEIAPGVEFAQFVDGDCEVAPGWIERAVEAIDAEADLAVVCGRRRERAPEASVYNLLCDIEWDTPVGEATSCGGDALMRIAAFREAGGFDPAMTAGEEPELCVRLRRAGWRIRRIDAEMTLHDASMTRFGQWWRRAVRSGYAYGLGASKHGRSPERHWVRQCARVWFWGFVTPAGALALAWPTWGVSVGAALLGYGAQWFRLWTAARSAGRCPEAARACATFGVIAKFAEFLGQLRFVRDCALRRGASLIEYKGGDETRGAGSVRKESPALEGSGGARG